MKRHVSGFRKIFRYKFFRSNFVGVLSTLGNLSLLGFLVEFLRWSKDAANIPSMVLGSAIQFFGHRTFVFGAQSGKMTQQGPRFVLGEAMGLALNVFGFWAATRMWPDLHYAWARLGVTLLVYLGFNYPYWKYVVFKQTR